MSIDIFLFYVLPNIYNLKVLLYYIHAFRSEKFMVLFFQKQIMRTE